MQCGFTTHFISRCDGIGRRDGLKIYNADSYHFGANP